MIDIKNIFEKEFIFDFLNKRNLLKQYKKSKDLILLWINWKTDFKLREPRKDWIYSFRINKQFRAFGYFENENLIVYKIDNHQN